MDGRGKMVRIEKRMYEAENVIELFTDEGIDNRTPHLELEIEIDICFWRNRCK